MSQVQDARGRLVDGTGAGAAAIKAGLARLQWCLNSRTGSGPGGYAAAAGEAEALMARMADAQEQAVRVVGAMSGADAVGGTDANEGVGADDTTTTIETRLKGLLKSASTRLTEGADRQSKVYYDCSK